MDPIPEVIIEGVRSSHWVKKISSTMFKYVHNENLITVEIVKDKIQFSILSKDPYSLNIESYDYNMNSWIIDYLILKSTD